MTQGNIVGDILGEVGGVGIQGGQSKLWLSQEVALGLKVGGERSHGKRWTHNFLACKEHIFWGKES